ncbi:hypothetical protein K8R43_01990 [archaeon]|nr:hypothetical protein [archaeon]
MKRFFLALFAMLIVCSIAFADFPVLDRQVDTRKAHINILTRTQEIGMQAVIEYFDELGNASSGKMPTIKEEFSDQANHLQTLTTHIAINNALRDLRGVSSDFRVESRERTRQHNGKALQILAKVTDALAEHESELDDLRDAYWEKRKENALEIFDLRVERAQNILDRLENHSYDITLAQAKLGEIEDKRSDLEAALDAHDNLEVISVHSEILGLSRELAQIVRDLQVDIPLKFRIRHWVGVGDRVIERTETIISELDSLGLDVTELESIHAEAEGYWNEAKTAYDEGDFEAAKEALENLRDTLRKLRDAYHDLVFGGELPEEIEPKVEAIVDSLDETTADMEETLPA